MWRVRSGALYTKKIIFLTVRNTWHNMSSWHNKYHKHDVSILNTHHPSFIWCSRSDSDMVTDIDIMLSCVHSDFLCGRISSYEVRTEEAVHIKHVKHRTLDKHLVFCCLVTVLNMTCRELLKQPLTKHCLSVQLIYRIVVLISAVGFLAFLDTNYIS